MTHQGTPRRKVNVLTALGVAKYGRRQLWASTGLGVAHLEGITRCPKSVLWPRWCHSLRYPQVGVTVEGATWKEVAR